MHPKKKDTTGRKMTYQDSIDKGLSPYQLTSTPSMSGAKLKKMQKQIDSAVAANRKPHQKRIDSIKAKLKGLKY
jgi:hypothetical protein